MQEVSAETYLKNGAGETENSLILVELMAQIENTS